MLRFPVLCSLGAGFAALALTPIACLSNQNGESVSFDAGGFPGFDSGPLPSIDGGSTPIDSSAPGDSAVSVGPRDSAVTDAPVDSSPLDAGPLPLLVHVTANGTPLPSVPIYFQDAKGAYVSGALTDATGTVSQMVVAGSQVTASLGTQAYPSLVTVQDVAPGDVLTFVASTPPSGELEGNITVTAPTPTWDFDGGFLVANAGGDCDPAYLPEDILSLDDGCVNGGKYSLLVQGDDQNGNEVEYTYQDGIPVPDDAGTATVTVTHAWTPSTTLETIALTNVYDGVDAGVDLNGTSVAYTEVANGVPSTQNPGLPLSPGTGSQTFPYHAGYADFVQTEANASYSNDDALLIAAGAQRLDADAGGATSSFDLSSAPLVTNATIDATDGGSPSQPILGWTSRGSLAAMDGVILVATWTDEGPQGGINGTWTIIAPATSSSVVTPAFPLTPSYAGPSGTATFQQAPIVVAVQSSIFGGYAGLKSLFGSIPLTTRILGFGGQNVVPILPAAGQALVVVFTQDKT